MSRLTRTLVCLAAVACFVGVPTLARQQAGSWTAAVSEALRLYGDGRIPEAIEILRKTKRDYPSLPAMHVLQLAQYLIEHVTSSPQMPRADAGRYLDEARALTDEVIARKQEVRLALMAKSMIVKIQADRVEQNADRRKALIAESDRLYEQSRWTSADGSPIAKTLDDDWREVQGKAMTIAADGSMKEDGAAYERFVKAHPDHAPALIALARFQEQQADAIVGRSAKSVAERTRLLEQASANYRRATQTATEPTDEIFALDGLISTLESGKLNRPAEAETIARAAIEKFPDQGMLVLRLVRQLLPNAAAATSEALRRTRDVVPATPQARHVYAMHLWDLSYRTKDLPRESMRSLLAEAVTALDGALKLRPDFVEALAYKAVVLTMQADRVEQDPARIKSLRAEADRLREQVKKLRSRKDEK